LFFYSFIHLPLARYIKITHYAAAAAAAAAATTQRSIKVRSHRDKASRHAYVLLSEENDIRRTVQLPKTL